MWPKVPDANDQQHGRYSRDVNVELGPDPTGYGYRGVRDPREPKFDPFTDNKKKAVSRCASSFILIFRLV